MEAVKILKKTTTWTEPARVPFPLQRLAFTSLWRVLVKIIEKTKKKKGKLETERETEQ